MNAVEIFNIPAFGACRVAERDTAGKIDTCNKQKANSTATTPNPMGGNTTATSGKTTPVITTMTTIATANSTPNPLGGNTTSGNTTPADTTTTAVPATTTGSGMFYFLQWQYNIQY